MPARKLTADPLRSFFPTLVSRPRPLPSHPKCIHALVRMHPARSLVDKVVPVRPKSVPRTHQLFTHVPATHRDRRCGIADSCGPYLRTRPKPRQPRAPHRSPTQTLHTHRAALSYSSNSGIASSFMFFGTASTSACRTAPRQPPTRHRPTSTVARTLFRQLHQEQLLALLRLRDVRRHERVLPRAGGRSAPTPRRAGPRRGTHHERLEVRPPPLREAVPDLPVVPRVLGLPRVRERGGGGVSEGRRRRRGGRTGAVCAGGASRSSSRFFSPSNSSSPGWR